ncbi:SulP family inorganic anion transporter [Candidatus Methanomassiliicoccus intestinalis]|jgi:sulfate transporter|uniref:STAS domain-containing protein n=1 Tax=Candidatus Methanomassiliicoccus intestinalis TaxID=1406512 RepID=A0A8J8TEY5_9ARCH|nr:MAG: hypothetical protein A3207_06465 [Candidatus Methanomassiliicoccus intestinalis]
MKLFTSVLPNGKTEIRGDLIAGITLATVAIPQAIGYANIAGMPLATGLYTLLIPSLLFAVFASSRHLSIGADSSTALILAGGLTAVAARGSADYISLALMVTLVVGILLIVSGILKLGFIADFLSDTVMIAFLTGVGIVIMVEQIPGMLGISNLGNGVVNIASAVFTHLDLVSFISIIIAAASLLIIFLSRKISRKIPDMLIVVIGSILISIIFNLKSTIDTIGNVSQGLPSLTFPTADSFSMLPQMSLTIASLFLVAVAKSASLSRVYSSKSHDSFDENRDLISLGIANIGAGLTGAFISSGTSGRTEVTYYAGGKGQFTQIVMSIIVIVVLVFLTAPLSNMPLAALSAIVFVIGLEMVDVKGLRSIIKKSKGEAIVAVASIFAVVFLGVEIGIVFAMVASLLFHVKSGYKPKNRLLVFKDGQFATLPVSSRKQALPGLIIYRFNSSMYYANAPTLREDLETLSNDVKWLCLDMSAVPSIDISAGDALIESINNLKEKNVKVVFSDVDPDVSKDLLRLGITYEVGPESFFKFPRDVVDAYEKSEYT